MIEFFSNNAWLVWLLVAILCLIIELGSGDLFVICFSIGALAASAASALGLGLVPQIIIFALVSFFSIYFLRPAAKRWLHRNDEDRPSNADALMGRVGRVSETIEAGGYGRVAIDGDDWKALSADGQLIEKDTSVRVVNRDSIILTVEKVS
jgi:membrane protein implicated in regulation of membrane protease activity